MGHIVSVATRNRIRNHGLLFDVSDPEFTPQVRAEMFWRTYESAEIRMIRRHLQDARTVVELGSSLGITTAHIASVLGTGGRLVCLEANPHLVDGLRRRAIRYRHDIALEVENAAVTERTGPVPFQLAASAQCSRVADNDNGLSGGEITVPSTTLREILARHRIDDFDLVSDIEGGEASYLLGDPGSLEGCRRAVIELHETSFGGKVVAPTDLIDAARMAGLRVVERHGPVVALVRG
ncbi:FkbM family methyltransferase [Frankia sp. CH37]|nr:FkbM family methyltransferase [Parafrankia sp. CH37]